VAALRSEQTEIGIASCLFTRPGNTAMPAVSEYIGGCVRNNPKKVEVTGDSHVPAGGPVGALLLRVIAERVTAKTIHSRAAEMARQTTV
jgi:hypothetical protein